MNKFVALIITLHRKRLLFVPPILLFVFAGYYQFNAVEVIFPNEKWQEFVSYSDSTPSDNNFGNSIVIDFIRTDDSITFTYLLQQQFRYPYAGFIINLSSDHKLFNFSRYRYLDIELDPVNSSALKVMIRAFVAGFSDRNKGVTLRYYCKEMDLIAGKHFYRLDLNDFHTPLWWYNLNKTTESRVGKKDLSQIVDIKIESGDLSPIDTVQTVHIYSITALRDNRQLLASLVSLIIIYLILYRLGIVIYNRTRKKTVIPYEKLQVENYDTVDLGKIVSSIGVHYNSKDLCLGKVADTIGVSGLRISSLIQKEFHCNFKQYLNNIRMSEATRLLKETDRQISDIAYNVGYNSLTHFNRVFKQFFNLSPTEYRRNLK